MQHTSYRKHRERRSPDRHLPLPAASAASAKRPFLRPSFLRPAAPPRAQKRSPVRSFDWTGLYTWRRPTLTGPIVPLPSALRRFTSGFGMGPGGSTALWPPEGGPAVDRDDRSRTGTLVVRAPRHPHRCMAPGRRCLCRCRCRSAACRSLTSARRIHLQFETSIRPP